MVGVAAPCVSAGPQLQCRNCNHTTSMVEEEILKQAPTLTPLNRVARFLCPACYLPAPLLLLPCLCSAILPCG